MLPEQGQKERLRKIAEQKRAIASIAGAERDPYHRAATGPRLLIFDELRSVKGIPFSPQWISKLVRDGLFPKPVKLGLGNGISGSKLRSTPFLERKAAERTKEAA